MNSQVSAWVSFSKIIFISIILACSQSVRASALLSDDFNVTTTEINPEWRFYDPYAGNTADESTLTHSGENVLISIPSGSTHDLWKPVNQAPRLLQPASDEDFQIEVKFETEPKIKYQLQGIIVQEADNKFLRFDIFYNISQIAVFAAYIDHTVSTPPIMHHGPISISSAFPNYQRVSRIGDDWVFSYSADGITWTNLSSFNQPLAVSEVGVFAGTAAGNPEFLSSVDYFVDRDFDDTPVVSLSGTPINDTDAWTPPASPPPVIDTWYAQPTIQFGQAGISQQWANILGNVSSDINIVSLSYTLNGGTEQPLPFGSTGFDFRLENKGDFNIEIDHVNELLTTGPNTIVIKATDSDGQEITKSITINYAPANIGLPPYTANWGSLSTIQDVESISHVVDGLWELTTAGIRTTEKGYDRAIAIGDETWPSDNYEVTVPFTPHSGFDGIGFGVGWQGHEVNSAVPSQSPRVGWPVQALAWVRGPYNNPTLEIVTYADVASNNWEVTVGTPEGLSPLTLGELYMLKSYSEPSSGGKSKFHVKFWKNSDAEPTTWNIVEDVTTRNGSVLLVSYKGDVTFGNVSVTPVSVPPDTTPPVIENILATVTDSTATITWDTDESSNSVVDYGTTTSYGINVNDSAQVTTHSLSFIDLSPNTLYHYQVESSDSSGNLASSVDQTLTTATTADTTPPVASTISTTVTDTTATITWTTDEPSTSVINYGESTPYTDTDASDTTLVTDHSVTLSGLTADTDYHFEIVSTDVSSNSGASADQLFTTGITINNGWWNNNWNYRASITVNSGNYARSEKPVEVIINFTSYLDAIDQTTAFDENSIRVHEVDVNGNIIAQNISFQFDSATDFDATTNAQGTLVFLLSGNTASQTDRYFQVYFDVEGGGYTPSTFTSQVNVTNDVSDEGQNSFQINSDNANYFYQKQGAGFSSIVDNNGNDWISYHQEVSGESGAANQFRGLPNLVSPANGGDFHPGATSALSVLMHEGPLKATIESITTDGLWKVQWEFFPNFARMTVNLAAENYWFLYEGTPGGTLDLADFMMRSDETQNLVDASWTSDISDPEWVYFSDPNVGNGRSLFLAHHTDDSAIDSYSPLDSATDLQMTVFGFGRDGMNSFIDKNQTHQFTIGLTDSTDFAGTSATIESAYRTINATITSSDQNPGVGGSNTAPTVEAGDDQTIALSVDATLDGTVSDDGLPTTPGTVTTLWTLISGPTGGTVLFADATQVDTTANFSVEGTYVLDLDADDSELASNDQITITVNAGGIDTTAPTIVGTISTTVTETTAILTWVTDEPTTSTVNYGENTTYSDTDNTDNVLVTNHSITLSNLTPETEYHFEVISSDGADNSATSADQSFTTSTQSIQNYTIYEDGEDGTTDGWIIYDQNPAGATITNVDDTDTASRIILFQGEGLQNGYRLGGNGGTPEAWNNASKVINWDMKFEESFVIYITVETTLGQRYLTYNQSSTSKIDGIYIINGLDNNQGTINSQWTSVSRNLESDLQVFEPTNEIISVNGFLVRGDGRIDNIKLPETTVNTAPTVDAGVAQTIALSVDATLDGTVSDDGLPTTPGTVTTLWTLISGPTGGTVLFADATQVDTTANFSVEGTYVLDLDADDSELTSNDQITITVNTGGIDTTAPTIVGTISTTVTETTAILTWVTDEPTTSTVNYGENTTYSDTDNTDNVLVTNHSITLSNLTPETEYHFEVISSDGADNSATSADQSFTTSTQSIQNYTIYEDGEDGTTDGWIIYDQDPAGATITNVDDTDTASRIILFQGEGLQNGYRLGGNGGTPEAWNNASKVINWDMKFEESFVIYITVETTLGQRYLTYNQSSTSKIDGIYIINGLDNNQGTINSQWTSVSRNLESDLQVFEPTNEIISVNGFLVRGDGRIDNIKLPETTVNTAPTVDAGVAQTIALSVDATLDGTVSDDGLPTTPGTVTTLWTLISGPTGGTVLFADATQVDTTANFSVEGTYVLDLDADDSELANNDQITITVNAGGADTTAPTIVGAISTTVTETTAILTWVTDELTTSTVNYGENIPYSEIDNTDNVLATNHSITLSNLTPETEYHFEVISSDGADNSATSADQSFTTSTQSIQNYTIYEDGEDGTTDGWIIYDQDPAGATITNVDDTDTASRIILFQGEGLQNGYRLGGNGGTPEAWNNASKVINWDMKFEESFVIYITVETTLGQRYLTYNQSSTSKIDGIYIINGLDNNQGTINSQWTSVSRNLESDLQVFEPTNEIISVNGFLVRGDGRIDNIKLPETTVNTAPTVDAGVAQTIALSVDATLDGTVSDDGLPTTPGAVTTLWTLISGPTGGTVLFADATQVDTTANFSVEGTYVLDLDADDSELANNDQITITVNAGGADTTAPTIVGAISTTVTDTAATITWTTDEPSTSVINYGESTTYTDSDTSDTTLVTDHSVTLSDLTTETDYHFEIVSADASTNSSPTLDQTFTTSATTGAGDLIAYWPLDEGVGTTATDNSGNGHNGTLVNDPTWSGNELIFDGVDDYINAGTFDVPGQALTLTGWIQSDDLGSCSSFMDCRIISKADSASEQGHYWMLSTIKVGSATRLRFRLKTDGVTSTLVASSGDLTNGEIFHAAATYDGTTMRLYKDGVEVGSLAKAGTIDSSATTEVWIGANPTTTGTSTRPWQGLISDIRVYQIALTATEVNAVKDADAGSADVIPPAIVGAIATTTTDTEVTITWTTNEPSTSVINYGETTTYGSTDTSDATLVTAHSVTVSGLTLDTEYHFEIVSTDGSSNSDTSADQSFTTAATADVTPPVASAISTAVTDTTATITWTTDEPSTSVINYGESIPYTDTDASDTTLVTDHSVTLSGLTAETDYHFEIISTDASTNSSPTPDQTFTTSAATGTGDLIAYWPLDEGTGTTATDNSGNGHNGTLVNDLDWSGNELLFDGVNDYVNVGLLNISGQALSLTGWVSSEQLDNCSFKDCRIISKSTGGAEQDHYFMLSTTKVGSQVYLRFRLKAGGSTSTLIASTGNLTNGEKFHVAATYDGSTMRLYKNAQEVGSLAKTGLIDANNTVETWLGGTPGNATQHPWKGSLANVRIYQKTLTPAEVSTIMNTDEVADITAPIISNRQVAVTSSSATISWNTNEVADGNLSYGSSNAYENGTVNGGSSGVSHSITLSGLTENTTYHYQITSTDGSNNTATSADFTFVTGAIGDAPELLMFDWNTVVTEANHGFPRDLPPMVSANGDWTSPVNYATGTFYLRAEIKSGGQPVPQTMRFNFCIWQKDLVTGNNFGLEECVHLSSSLVGNVGNELTWTGQVDSMAQISDDPLDWTRIRHAYGIAIKNTAKNPVSDYLGWDWFGEDPTEWYPLDVRFTVVVVPNGQTFSGWGNYIN